MFIELTTASKQEKVTFNTDNIVLLSYDKKGTYLVDVNGIDWTVLESYKDLKSVVQTLDFGKNDKAV